MKDTFTIPFAYKEKIDRNNRFLPKQYLIEALSTDRMKELIEIGTFKAIDKYICYSTESDYIDKNYICTILSLDLENMNAQCKFENPNQYDKNMELYFAYLGSIKYENGVSKFNGVPLVVYPVVSSTLLSAYR